MSDGFDGMIGEIKLFAGNFRLAIGRFVTAN